VFIESTQPSNGLVAHLEKEAEKIPANNDHTRSPEQEDEDEGDDEVDLGEESDEDVSLLLPRFLILSNSSVVRMLKLLWNLLHVRSISGEFLE